MLSPTKIGLVALAAATSAFLMPSSAEARGLFGLRFLDPDYYGYYPAPDGVYAPDYYGDGRDYYYVPRKKRHPYYDQQDSYYDPQYDEPVYVKPHKKKKIAKTAPAANPVVKKPVVTTSKKNVPTASQTAGGMSCDKAGKIISDYGFSSVKATSCKGKVYAFNATRSGKNYLISLNAASGELTEVKKAQ
jgi:hypothetical protein